MPSFLQKSLADVPDLATVTPGEYTLNFSSAKVEPKNLDGTKEPDPNHQKLTIRLSIEGEPNAWPVTHYLSMPADDDSEEDEISKRRRIKDFANGLGVDPEEFMQCLRDAYEAFFMQADQGSAFQPLKGSSMLAILTEEEYNGIKSNKIKSFVKPR